MGMSKGEQRILEILSEYGFLFKTEVSFDDLKWKEKLRFDFAIYDRQDYHLLLLIEFDGEQHFKEVKRWGGHSGFIKRQELDRQKNSYCLAHKYPLLRIPYWDLNKLTYEKIFYSPEYLVRSIWHNDRLIKGVIK